MHPSRCRHSFRLHQALGYTCKSTDDPDGYCRSPAVTSQEVSFLLLTKLFFGGEGGGHVLRSRDNVTVCLMSAWTARSLFVRRVPVGVTGFPNPATKIIGFIPGGERRTWKGSKCRFRFFFPRSRFLPPLLRTVFASYASVVRFVLRALFFHLSTRPQQHLRGEILLASKSSNSKVGEGDTVHRLCGTVGPP